MELLTRTLFKQYDLTDEEKLQIYLYYQMGILAYLNTIIVAEVNGFPTAQRYLLNW